MWDEGTWAYDHARDVYTCKMTLTSAATSVDTTTVQVDGLFAGSAATSDLAFPAFGATSTAVYRVSRHEQRLWAQMQRAQHNMAYHRGEQFIELLEVASALPSAPPVVSAPDERAKSLFLSMITPEQRAQFDALGRVEVVARGSGRRYYVECRGGRHGNIIEVGPNHEHLARLCVAPGGPIPHFDAILGQIVALQHDEQSIRDAANFTALVAGYRRVA